LKVQNINLGTRKLVKINTTMWNVKYDLSCLWCERSLSIEYGWLLI
jgi:hypothetical protein